MTDRQTTAAYAQARASRPNVRALASQLPGTARRRFAGIAACVAAAALVLVVPSSAHGGWPLDAAAPVVLGFGATYTAADGTPATHRGIDVAAAAGLTVRAPLAGRVSFVGRVPATGGGTVLAVTIATPGGSLTLMPLDSAAVKSGTELAEGDAVGKLADTGDSSSAGAHLHIGARKGDLYIDPLSLIAPPAPTPVDAGDVPQPSPVAQPKTAASPGVAGAPVAIGAGQPAVGILTPSGATAPQVACAGTGLSAAGAGSSVAAAVPGASLAPGVSVAGAVEAPATAEGVFQVASAAFSAATGGHSAPGANQGANVGGLIEWVLGLASHGLQMGGRLLAGALLALGALWPLWRREKRGKMAVSFQSDPSEMLLRQ